MPIFLVTPLSSNADQVGQSVRENLPEDDRFELPQRSGWLVVHRGTTVELSNAIGITAPGGKPTDGLGSALVTSIGSYYGLGGTQMWEWLKTRFERQS